MAALYWNSEVRALTPREQIHNLRSDIEAELRRWGFSDVHRNALEVAGAQNGVYISIAHFPIDSTRCYEVVMGSGDDFEATKNTVIDLASKVRNCCQEP